MRFSCANIYKAIHTITGMATTLRPPTKALALAKRSNGARFVQPLCFVNDSFKHVMRGHQVRVATPGREPETPGLGVPPTSGAPKQAP